MFIEYVQYCLNCCSFSHFTPPYCSDPSASSASFESKTRKRGSKSTKRSRSYSEITVRDVIQGILTKEVKDAGRNPQLLKLSNAIKEAVYDPSPMCQRFLHICIITFCSVSFCMLNG